MPKYFNFIFIGIIKRLLIIILFSFPISSEEVRIGILTKYALTEIEIELENTRILYSGKDKTLKNGIWKVENVNGKIQFVKEKAVISGEHILISSDKVFTVHFADKGNKLTRTYKGSLEIYDKDRKFLLVLILPLEEYVSSSTFSELGELLFVNNLADVEKRNDLIAAQEIVIRTYILHEKKRHSEEEYDFCDLTHCIHFVGTLNKQPIFPSMILAGNSPVNGYFHSTCGGHLSGPEIFWLKHKKSSHYRRGIDGDEPNCKDSPHLEWETLLTISDLENILGEKNIISIHIVRKDERIQALKFTNIAMESKVIPITNFFSKAGKLYGWNKIKSNDFTIEKIDNMYKIKGHGLGHGIGLCQWGASGLAAKGKSYKEILGFYFPNTVLKKRSSLGENLP